MKTLSASVLAVLVPLTALAADPEKEKEKAVKQEQETLQGQWRQFSVEIKGQVKEIPATTNVLMTIDGEKWTTESRAGKFESTAKIDPTQTPKTLDRTRKARDGAPEEPADKCLYKLDKDTLTLAVPRSGIVVKPDDSKERPKDFQTTETGMVLVFKRVKK